MKKLIIVTVVIMLASCATVKRTTSPEEGRSARTDRGLAALPTEGGSVWEISEDQDPLILATLWYQKSAEMRALYYQCFRNAETALMHNLALAGYTTPVAGTPAPEGTVHSGDKKPPAVVLDIDETLLDNSPFQGWQVLEKKSFNNDDWFRWVELARARPLPGAVEFTRYADSLGVEVFYVSNRTVKEMGPTIENMAVWGFVNADSTHMLLKETTSSKVERRDLIKMDYEVLLLIGDNLADHSGIYEKRGPDHGFAAVDADRRLFGTKYIVLPNPMYGNWLNDLLRSASGGTEREKLVRLLETF
ncbi:MAG: 5'-nucleotidase, lipoprotein e(P4) family [Bacteroidales bacterium]|jgi:5'-nucleotidase (lipoprotein e(P4) family)|nr:5'-nucleotidase, lipoprotein e(P4) family [Bacteroidales bacterium]